MKQIQINKSSNPIKQNHNQIKYKKCTQRTPFKAKVELVHQYQLFPIKLKFYL